MADDALEEQTLVFHDEIELEDFEYDEDDESYYYPCPCGDRFVITKEDLEAGEEIAECPSCSLIVKVIYDPDDFTAGEQKLLEAVSKVKITA
jgi:diphthamide biosynthesis protein 3